MDVQLRLSGSSSTIPAESFRVACSAIRWNNDDDVIAKSSRRRYKFSYLAEGVKCGGNSFCSHVVSGNLLRIHFIPKEHKENKNDLTMARKKYKKQLMKLFNKIINILRLSECVVCSLVRKGVKLTKLYSFSKSRQDLVGGSSTVKYIKDIANTREIKDKPRQDVVMKSAANVFFIRIFNYSQVGMT